MSPRLAPLLGPDLEAILESRQQVSGIDLTAPPFSAIGYLAVRFASGATQTGTGFLVDPATVVTAAHVLYSPAEGQGIVATFTPGCFADRIAEGGDRSPQFTQAVDRTRMRIRQGWSRTSTAIEFDYGAIFLPDSNKFKNCGQLQLQSLTDGQLDVYTSSEGIEFQIAGFPFEKPKGSQWFARGVFRSFDAQAIRYYIGTTVGQSGSPVFGIGISKSTGQKIPIVVGIHSRFEEDFNVAHRIDERFLADLARWRAEIARLDQAQPTHEERP